MKIGLTGGIASGKSTAARYLEQLGASVIDADKLGHRVYEPGTAGFRAVVHAFGDDIVGDDGLIDRRALGGKVFGDPDALKRLTDIVWPEIRALAEAEMAAQLAEDPGRVVVLEAAVLFEAGWQDAVDEVWTVVVAPEVAVARACARDGLSEEDVRRRLDAQMSNDERRAMADVVIDNSGDTETLLARLDREWLRVIGNDGRSMAEQAV
ncbi:MAG: dephospho-CoA kinase [Gammaproteobacteria bacterium]|nr:dephospho-CoA kinase [Gammaproteobacteria bacterium]|tara:strand:- start:608 stop:1234 length:627 start_codon:yes stop_codon:yes gene_type:complete